MGAALSSMLAAPESLLTFAVVAAIAWVVVKILSQPKVPRIVVDTSYITEKQEESKTNRYIYVSRCFASFIAWLLSEGEKYLKPEYRSVGRTMMHKVARVEFEPAGVIGAIVPWNYPFHNVLNPVLSAVFSGNAAVIK
ncbi:unnamed protein product, partial [Closterium sp. NIES-53]